MIAFTRKHGGYVARFEPVEATVLMNLADELVEQLDAADATDAATLRLLPDAYRGDPEAAAEFRRYTQDGLVERKIRNARAISAAVQTVAAGGVRAKVVLSPDDAQAWIRGLSDIRLTLATRLGIETDDDEPDWEQPVAQLYGWLGYVQESLVQALS